MPESGNTMPVPEEEKSLTEDEAFVAGKLVGLRLIERPAHLIRPKFKYFWTAFYSDNTYFNQHPDDISMIDPLRSSFFDIDHERLVSFALTSAEHMYAVHLFNGSFSVDATPPFRMHQDEHRIVGPFKLVFFRRHDESINMPSQEQASITRYLVGWQALNVNGENVQRLMELD